MPPGLPLPALDLHVVFDVADDMPSGEEPMGDNPAGAALGCVAAPLSELPRVVQVCRVVCSPSLSYLLPHITLLRQNEAWNR